jgi:hypothetical protein
MIANQSDLYAMIIPVARLPSLQYMGDHSISIALIKNILTNKHIDLKIKMKGTVRETLCFSILLYGNDIWCLREDVLNRLRHYHHRCLNHVPHYHCSNNLLLYFICQPL